MKNYYTIEYQVVGGAGKRTDKMGVHAKSFAEAISEFTNHAFRTRAGDEYTYNESAIVNIKQYA